MTIDLPLESNNSKHACPYHLMVNKISPIKVIYVKLISMLKKFIWCMNLSTGVTGNIIAYILVRVNLGKEYELLEQINKLSNIDEVRIVYGEYDMIIKVKVNTLYELDKVVTHVRRLNGVITTTTLISS